MTRRLRIAAVVAAAVPSPDVLTFSVGFDDSTFPCPSPDEGASISYRDASGTIAADGFGDTWNYVGNDNITGAPRCELSSLGAWSLAGTDAFSGLDRVTFLDALIPGFTFPVSENQIVQAGAIQVDIDNG